MAAAGFEPDIGEQPILDGLRVGPVPRTVE
jgi:hypothetical protein